MHSLFSAPLLRIPKSWHTRVASRLLTEHIVTLRQTLLLSPCAHGIPPGGCSALPALWGRKLNPEPVSSIPGEVPGGT